MLPDDFIPNNVLAVAASVAVTNPIIGAVVAPVPPRAIGTVAAVISCPSTDK